MDNDDLEQYASLEEDEDIPIELPADNRGETGGSSDTAQPIAGTSADHGRRYRTGTGPTTTSTDHTDHGGRGDVEIQRTASTERGDHGGRNDDLSVCKVGPKFPIFGPEKPAVWFAQVEGQFALCGITVDSTKFYHVTAQLPPAIADEVEDIILSPPEVNKYDYLKSELIKRLSASREQSIKQLLTQEEMGDRKPSQFLRRLQSLAGPTVPKDFIRLIWASRLPPNFQFIIASQSDSTLEAVAELADHIHDLAPAGIQVASTSTARPEKTNDDLSRKVSELARQVEALTTQVRNQARPTRSHTRNRSRSRQRSSSRHSRRPDDHPYCWYHYCYGSKAKKCVTPCAYKSENSTGRQ